MVGPEWVPRVSLKWGNLFDPPIYLSKPSAVATSPFSDYFANKAAILANNAHAVMIHQKLRYQNVKIALFGNRK